MPSLNDTLLALAQTQNETARRLDRLERQGTSPAGAGPAGTVTSVGLSAPSWLTVSGSPITTYGTLALSATSQAPNMVLAGPASGGAAAPTFRALVAADLPAGMGLGTVTQVGLAMPAMFTVTGTPVTTTGTLTAALANQAGHAVFIGPNSGTPAAPTFRALVEQDLPASVVLAGSITVYPSGIFDPSTGGGPGDADFNLDFLTQSANTIFAGPASGGAVEPSFRAMVTADIPNAAVTYAKIQNVATSRLLGRSTAGAGVVEEIAIGSGLSLAAGTLSCTVVGTITGSGTPGKLTKFSGASAIGDSIITESGAAISAAGALTLAGQSDTNQLIVKSYSTQTSGQILIQTSAAAELARIYVSASNAIAIGYQAGASLSSSTGSVLIGYQAGSALASNPAGPFIGYQAGKLSTAIDNLAIGNGALATQTTGAGNTAIGHNALAALNSSGSANLAIGDHSSEAMTSGQYNVSIGSSALAACLSGQNNVAIGAATLFACTGSGNISVGAWSAYYLTTGGDNMFFGYAAAMSCNGSRNVAMGSEAGRTSSVSTFSDSIYIGYRSGYNGTAAGSNNVAIGSETLQKNVSNAVAIGFNAGKVQTGAGFTAIGYQAGLLSTSGTNSTLIGSGAGASLTTNGGCVMIGYQAGNAETAANKLYIANSSTTTPLIYGDFSTPSLTFNGTVNIADAKNIVFGTTTGSKLGATTSDKFAFWAATPIVQPTTGVAAATFTANAGTAVNDASTFDGYTIRQVVKALRNMGLLA